ncbi:MAG: cupin domain-containing protein [Methanophagales archaeon]|nr:cupin domain-containing protein [Methanophagales archaeon]
MSGEVLIKDIKNCEYFRALDNSSLCELLQVAKDKEARCSVSSVSLAHAIVKPGETTLPHKLKTSAEVYFILEGAGRMKIEDETAEVRPGQAVYIPPNSRQCIQNTGSSDLKFLCVVSPMWRKEDDCFLSSTRTNLGQGKVETKNENED